ncbi:hypothetical protein L7F22_054946 [Adiantum nelumboides]|nr:hypothetical protein [Adiantum nelumboides]
MIYSELELPLRLISQHFRVQKPPRYTEPPLHMAVVMALCVAEKRPIRCDYGKFILENLIKPNLKNSSKNKLYMSVAPMLTRIAYHALASSRTTRSTKKSSSDDDEKIDTDKDEDSEKSDKEEDSQKGAEAKGPSKHELSDQEDTSTPLDIRKAKLEKAKEIQEEKRRLEAETKAQEEAASAQAAQTKEKEMKQDFAEQLLVPPSSQKQDKQEDQPKDKEDQEVKQTDTANPKPGKEFQTPLMQLEGPIQEEAYEEVTHFDYTKIIFTMSRQFQCQRVVAQETSVQKVRAQHAYEEIENLRMALKLVTQERDSGEKENENLLRDLMDVQCQLTRKEAQCHELVKNEKKLKEQLRYGDARFQKVDASYNTIKNTLTTLMQNQEPDQVVASTSDSATMNTLIALQEELQTKKLQR